MEIPEPTTPPIGPQSPPTTIAEGITTRKKILLVDDNPVNQKVMVKTLMKLGFKNIEVASDGRQGVDTYNKGGSLNRSLPSAIPASPSSCPLFLVPRSANPPHPNSLFCR